MKKWEERMILGGTFIALFALWTVLIQCVDVKPVGQNGTDIGFATFNCWFHQLTGVNMTLYIITDWMGLVPLFVCMIFAGIGFFQLVKRKNLLKVDSDILILGIYYIAVIFCYVLFEMITINYRPVFINGVLEHSYPSSTTLLVLAVMPTLAEQTSRKLESNAINGIIKIFVVIFSAFMVFGRLICGVHWFTDIVGAVLLCAGLFNIYKAAVIKFQEKEN